MFLVHVSFNGLLYAIIHCAVRNFPSRKSTAERVWLGNTAYRKFYQDYLFPVFPFEWRIFSAQEEAAVCLAKQ